MNTKKFPINFVRGIPSHKSLKTPHRLLILVGYFGIKSQLVEIPDIDNFSFLQMHFQSGYCKFVDLKGIWSFHFHKWTLRPQEVELICQRWHSQLTVHLGLHPVLSNTILATRYYYYTFLLFHHCSPTSLFIQLHALHYLQIQPKHLSFSSILAQRQCSTVARCIFHYTLLRS